MSEDEQKRVAQAFGGDMSSDHKAFVKLLAELIEKGTIDPSRPASFLKQTTYARIDDRLRAKVDMMLPNLAILLGHIVDFYKSKQTPDACPQLANMIDQLWEMKMRVENDADVFVF